MAIDLQLAIETTLPVEVQGIIPSTLRGKSLDEVRRMPIRHGNRPCQLGDLFQATGSLEADNAVHWRGQLNAVHWVGANMDGGVMVVHGDAGRHVGSEMSRGAIEVRGNAGDWVGGELHGGVIHVHGDAGHLVGAAYRGSARGMTGGEIFVHGSAGDEVGHTMRRGAIVVGSVGDLAGCNMLAGTLMICGKSGLRHGAGMRRGTLLFANDVPQLLPSFRHAGMVTPPFIRLFIQSLQRRDYPVEPQWLESHWILHHGDMIEGGRGEVLVRVVRPTP